jgi:5-methylcytosine-specific restriction protein A
VLLTDALKKILNEYPRALSETFKRHPLAAFLRKDLPESIRRIAEIPAEFEIEGSAGQGQWTRCPWIAVLDPLVTDTAQKGYYVVYLFREDFSGFYLSLNQVVTDVRKIYKTDAKSALRARASDFRARLPKERGCMTLETIDLRPSSSSNYSADYEAGNILSVFYDASETLSESALVDDLRQALGHYSLLSETENIAVGTIGVEEDEQNNPFIEDYSAFRQHKRIERNSRLSAEVKRIHGYVCQACGFDFEKVYPGIEKNRYIEAHHLIPIADLKGQRLRRDPKTDFAVLCANCHRMIHRCEKPWDLQTFRQNISFSNS